MVVVRVVFADKVELEDAAAFWAPGDFLVLDGDPERLVRLVLARAADVAEGVEGIDEDGLLEGAELAKLDGLHVKHVHARHLAQNLQSLETRRLVEIRRQRSPRCTRWQ